MFENIYGQNTYSPAVLTDFIIGGLKGGSVGAKKIDNNTLLLPKSEFYRLCSRKDVTSHTTGFRGSMAHTARGSWDDYDYVKVTFTGGTYGAYMKDARNKNYFAVTDVRFLQTEKDASGAPIVDTDGNVKVTKSLPAQNGNRMYFDSHITSQPDDAKLGYLGARDKKGQIRETKGFSITNSQDTRYQDAIMADKTITDMLIGGTDYQSDGTISELPGYGQ